VKALVVSASGPTLVSDHPFPEAPPGESLVRVRLAGICATDLELARGYMGFSGVVGHEFPLEQADRALQCAGSPGVLKVLVRPVL